MSKAVKELMTGVLRKSYAGIENACVVDLTGLRVPEQEQLRRDLREKSARLEVVKNSLASQAFRETPLEPLGRALDGPCALVTTSASLIDAARVLVAAAKEFKSLGLKQAILDGNPNLINVEELARMKGRLELLGELAMLVTSPGRNLAGCLSGPQSRVAGCLKTLADRAA